MFGQNPNTGQELRRLQMEIREQGEDNMDSILNKWDFKTHHEI